MDLKSICNAISAIAPAATRLEEIPTLRESVERACTRGYLTPAEEGMLRLWFARYLKHDRKQTR